MITYKTFLMHQSENNWLKLVDIKDFPDLFGTPEALDKTTLSNRGRVYESGIEENSAWEFTANYDYDTFKKLRSLKDTEVNYAIWFGGDDDGVTVTPTGVDGKFKCAGKLSVGIVGKGVNEIQEMRISITPSSDVVVDE